MPVAAALRARPWLVVPIAAAELALVIADGLIGGPYAAVTVASLGLAAVVADARLRVALRCRPRRRLRGDGSWPTARRRSSSHDGRLAGVLGAMLGYPFAALVVLGLAGLFRRFVANVDGIVDDDAQRRARPDAGADARTADPAGTPPRRAAPRALAVHRA